MDEFNGGLYSIYNPYAVEKSTLTDPNVHLDVYDTRIKIVGNGWVEVRRYDKKIVNLKGFEKSSDLKNNESLMSGKCGRKSKNELIGTIARSSLSRTRQKLIEYVTGNADQWKTFLTLTFADENRQDISECNKLFDNFRRSVSRACKKQGSEFVYIGVPEFQKNGRVHYHLLTNLELGSELLPKQKGSDKYYDVKYWNHGFTSAFDIIGDTDSKFNAALYMVKYLYKDFDERLYGSTRLLKSNNLKAPTCIKLLAESHEYVSAMNYLNDKGYLVTECYSVSQSDENPFIVPSVNMVFEPLSGHLNLNEFEEFLQDEKGLQF